MKSYLKEISFRPGYIRVVFRCLFFLLINTVYAAAVHAQAITGIFTDFGGYWQSSAATPNPVQPTLSHNLLAFTYNGITYSTGVNNATLLAQSVNFTGGNFEALPVSSIGGTVTAAQTYIWLASSDDGVPEGSTTPLPAVQIKDVLTDGIKGLNIGTGVTNLPTSSLLTFGVNSIVAAAIGDDKPDILYTQIAAPSPVTDMLYFVNSSGVRVGNVVNVIWSSIDSIGRHRGDLYTLNTVSCDDAVINGVFSTFAERPLRLSAFKLSDFGITSGNSASIVNLVIDLGGTSDPAFVAYNADAFAAVLLPVQFTSLKGTVYNGRAHISWQTASESNSDRFVIEKSKDGETFTPAGTVKSVANSTKLQNYNYVDADRFAGVLYYRIRQYDMDGKSILSETFKVSEESSKINISIQANASNKTVMVYHPQASGRQQLQVSNMQGVVMAKAQAASGATQTSLNTLTFPAGVYQLMWTDGKEKVIKRFVLK